MLLKNPQMLWALGLIIVPVIIHLLRFRRFRKTPFTNVRILQQILQKSNQGNKIKEWLILFSRVGFMASLIIAFAQPYLADPAGIKPKEIVIYLDNSFSMQAPSNGTTLLNSAVQKLLQEMPGDIKFSLITNNQRFKERSLESLSETLLNLEYAPNKVGFESLLLRGSSLLSKSKEKTTEFWLISDFRDENFWNTTQSGFDEIHAVRLLSKDRQNINLDTAYVVQYNGDFLQLKVAVTLEDSTRLAPVSVFEGDRLLAQSIPVVSGENRAEIVFSLPSETSINGIIRVSDTGLSYDNNLYFNLLSPPKIKVYAIGETQESYLSRIFTTDEFEFNQSGLSNLDYGLLPNQDLIVLNELPKITDALISALESYQKSGGTLLIIPSGSADRISYNTLLKSLTNTAFGIQNTNTESITDIAFDNELFSGVFEEKVENFDYPMAFQYFQIETTKPGILNFQNGLPFLVYSNNAYILASGLTSENSNFATSPLIVPTFYKIAQNSLAFPRPYYVIGNSNVLDLDISLSGDQIIRITNDNYSIIPQQKRTLKRVSLQFGEDVQYDGNYEIKQENDVLGTLGLNYDRHESSTGYPDFSPPDGLQIHESLEGLFDTHRNKTSINQLWKWFVNLALLFVIAEILLQKFWK